jgi:hypothetical protein
MGKRNLLTAAGVLSLLLTIPFGAAPAATAASANEASGPHCAVEVHPTATPEQSGAPVCFDTEDEVAEYLASIGVAEISARGAAAASTVVGTVYKDTNGAGASLTFWGASGCSGVTFGFPSLASGWNNSISSVRASNGCWVTVYTATSYGGSRLNCTPYCASIGTWSDNVKSLVFRPSGTFG